ncbi:sugar phosphate isomerase/epimerase family protein [Lunatibacter salilacus]|uniref:sugar phosphate isomerase/epimerase family protein n=1 Tax=Lunatibacter salilacus TaxID=2483804 RepID=UPI00131ACB30|nr:sugar phosphate isomerase/epimerase family protein [Lunatibacter salilacus]
MQNPNKFNRRNFIRLASLGALGLHIPNFPAWAAGKKMGIVVHSYAARWQSKTASNQYPGFRDAVDLLHHCHSIGAGGIQVTVRGWASDFAKKVRDEREKSGLYLEGSIGLPKSEADMDLFEEEVKLAKEAGAEVLRCVSLGPRRYEALHSYREFLEFQERGLLALQLAEPVLKKYRIKLAVENHKDWRSEELVAILHKLDSEWIGVTLDFGNSIALLEDPIYTAKVLAPYVYSTHIKDMAVETHEQGFLMSEVPLGEGILDLGKIAGLCQKFFPSITFNLEMITRDPLLIPCLTASYWPTFHDQIPASAMAHILEMVKTHQTTLPRTRQMDMESLLALEEKNVRQSLAYSESTLNFNR